MAKFIPKMWEVYYTVDENGSVIPRMNRQTKEDIFNVISGNCYHTEDEAKADDFIQLRRMDKARELMNEDFINRFSKHLDKV